MVNAEGQPETVEDLTATREGDDRLAARKELKKQIVTKGSWATVMYLFEELTKKKDEEIWVKKFSFVRYRKMKGTFRFQKEFAVSKKDHAQIIADTMVEWLKDETWTE